MPPPEMPDAREATVEELLASGKVTGLSPLQQAAKPFVWVFVLGILVLLGIVVYVWISKLPPVPALGADDKAIATYRELTDIAKSSAEGLIEEIFTKALLPLLLLFAGVFVGRSLKKSDE